jgi:hypothetical protein
VGAYFFVRDFVEQQFPPTTLIIALTAMPDSDIPVVSMAVVNRKLQQHSKMDLKI